MTDGPKLHVLKQLNTEDIGELVSLPRDEFCMHVMENLETASNDQLRALLCQTVERLQRAPDEDGARHVVDVLHQVSRSPTIFTGVVQSGDAVYILYENGLLKLFVSDTLVELVNVVDQIPNYNPSVITYGRVQTFLKHLLQFPVDDNLTLMPIRPKAR